MISGPQYRKLMETYQETGKITASAIKAGVDRKTAAKYIHGAPGPNEQRREPRHWRTREDPFEGVWEEVEGWLQAKPDLQAKNALEELLRLYPESFEEGQLRSLQRRFREWKQEHGLLQKPVFFEQTHVPGRLLQLDWFHPRDFEVTLGGEVYKHLICHTVLTYSNWEWVMPCRSESFASLRSSLQASVWEAGGVPEVCQVDNSSTATHQRGKGSRQRAFNDRFLGLLAHYGMRAQTIQVGAANENGDVESSHSHLRGYLADALALRGSNDFENLQAYRQSEGMAVERQRNRDYLSRFVGHCFR